MRSYRWTVRRSTRYSTDEKLSTSAWVVRDTGSEKEREFASRGEAENTVQDLEEFGLNVEFVPPSGPEPPSPQPEVLDTETGTIDPGEYDFPERSISDDPLKRVPDEFIDEIDGTQAINRKGFEVLAHFYDIDVETDVQVSPYETAFT